MGDHMKIVLLCGSKESGKTTAATAIYGYQLVARGAIPNAQFDELGRMRVVYNEKTNQGILFDIDDQNEQFLEFKRSHFDSYVNHASFADQLKNTSQNLFGLDGALIRGTNDDKNRDSHIKWENMAKLLGGPKQVELKKANKLDKLMTNREFLEVFGTDICRTIDPECHIRSAYNKLVNLNPEIGIIPDCRFDNELLFFDNKPGVFRIKFSRNVHKSNAPSEVGLDSLDDSKFDLVIDNGDLPVDQKNKMVIDFLIRVGVLDSKTVKVN
jgi:hypothetical protein